MENTLPEGKYKIIESNYAVAFLFGHNLIVLADPFGRIVGEMQGFATSKKGKIKAIGYWGSDKLKAHEFRHAYLYKKNQPQKTLYEDVQEAVMKKWNAAREAKDAINQKDLHYPFLGIGKNSNAVTSTLIAAMGLNEPVIPRAKWSPSKGCLLLSKRKINEIRNRYGIIDNKEN